ncbi:MAG: PqqD family protein [Deltaproteobacteria bacterium]|nr:MAG: PqqD family protein [Deltaproteobacteria bacterium]
MKQERERFSPHTIVQAAPGKTFSAVEDEVVVLDLEKGTYYALDEVGRFVWEGLQAPKRVGELEAAILETYEVEPDVCRNDLLELLADLDRQGLIEIVE